MNIEEILKSLGINIDQYVGDEIRIECPFCHSPHKKGYVNRVNGLCICFNCGFQSNFTGFLSRYTGKSFSEIKNMLHSDDFADPGVNKAAEKTPDPFTQMEMIISSGDSVGKHTPISKLRMPPKPTNCHYLLDNFNNRDAYPFFNYAHRRGISLNDIRKYHISYVKDGTFYKKDKSKGEIIDSLVFFTFNEDDKPIYWNSRAIHNFIQPKSLNASALTGQRSRKETIFNLNNLRQGQDIYLAEGVFNAITLDHMSNKACGVCTFGKNVTAQQVRLLEPKSNMFNHLYICQDSDAFDNEFKVYDLMTKYGIPEDKIYLVNDKELGIKDWNDIGSRASGQLIQKKAFRPTAENRLREMIE